MVKPQSQDDRITSFRVGAVGWNHGGTNVPRGIFGVQRLGCALLTSIKLCSYSLQCEWTAGDEVRDRIHFQPNTDTACTLWCSMVVVNVRGIEKKNVEIDLGDGR